MKLYTNTIETFGYMTKANRLNLKIDKDHYLDACVIASAGNPFILKTDKIIYKKCISKGDYQQTKGVRSEQRIPTNKIQGFKKFDKVRYFGKECFIKGRMSSGYAILMDVHVNKLDFSYLGKGKKTPKLSFCKRIGARKSIMVDEERL